MDKDIDNEDIRAKKKTFILHTDTLSILDDMEAEKVKDLFIAMRDYNAGNNIIINDPVVKAYFSMFKTFFDRDSAKYEERCDKNRENIRKRWERLNNQNQNTNVYERIQPNTNDTKHTDTDTDTDTDTVTDTDLSKEKDISKDISKKKDKSFRPPSLEDIQNYCIKRSNNVNPQRFYDFYQSKGWMVGKNKMKDWQAAIRTWEQRDDKTNSKTNMLDLIK